MYIPFFFLKAKWIFTVFHGIFIQGCVCVEILAYQFKYLKGCHKEGLFLWFMEPIFESAHCDIAGSPDMFF